MKLTSEEMDSRILDALNQGDYILSDLAVKTACDARELLKRLHVLGGMKRVQCNREDGSLVWALYSGDASKAETISPPAPQDTAPATAPAPEPPAAAPVPAPAPAPAPAKRHSQQPRLTHGLSNPIVVRAAVYVPEMRVLQLSEKHVLLEEVHHDGAARPNDGLVVATSEIPALIAALTAIHQEATA